MKRQTFLSIDQTSTRNWSLAFLRSYLKRPHINVKDIMFVVRLTKMYAIKDVISAQQIHAHMGSMHTYMDTHILEINLIFAQLLLNF